jgi:hypothetical protein
MGRPTRKSTPTTIAIALTVLARSPEGESLAELSPLEELVDANG